MKMIPALLRTILLMALPVLTGSALALPVDGLYAGEIAVEGQGEQERREAYREAMRRVLVKVTGDPARLDDEGLQTAIANAADYVEEVSYRSRRMPVRIPENEETDDDGGQSGAAASVGSQLQPFMHVSFAEDQLNRLLRRRDIPIWGSNRPAVLIWLVIQDDDGRREILSSDSNHPALEVIRAFSQRRAIPLLIPLMDLTDRRNLSVEQAWALDEEALRQASARYGADSILAGRMLETGSGEIAGLWQLQFREQTEGFDNLADGLEAYLQQPLDRATVTLARHYALQLGDDRGERQVTLAVDEVDGLNAYADVLDYLEDIDLVRSVAVSRLRQDSVELTLTINGSAERLSEFIALDRDLQPAADAPDSQGRGDGPLQYRWTR